MKRKYFLIKIDAISDHLVINDRAPVVEDSCLFEMNERAFWVLNDRVRNCGRREKNSHAQVGLGGIR